MQCPVCGGDARPLGDGLYQCTGPHTGSGYDTCSHQFFAPMAASAPDVQPSPPQLSHAAPDLNDAVAAARLDLQQRAQSHAAAAARVHETAERNLRDCRDAIDRFFATMRAEGFPGTQRIEYQTPGWHKTWHGTSSAKRRKVTGWWLHDPHGPHPRSRSFGDLCVLSVEGDWYTNHETTAGPCGLSRLDDQAWLEERMRRSGPDIVQMLVYCLATHTSSHPGVS